MFFKKYSEDDLYLYLIPQGENNADWEIIDQVELDRRMDENLLTDNSRLFKIEKEIKVRLETITHLD